MSSRTRTHLIIIHHISYLILIALHRFKLDIPLSGQSTEYDMNKLSIVIDGFIEPLSPYIL